MWGMEIINLYANLYIYIYIYRLIILWVFLRVVERLESTIHLYFSCLCKKNLFPKFGAFFNWGASRNKIYIFLALLETNWKLSISVIN